MPPSGPLKVILLLAIGYALAECPNACSGQHMGLCGPYDACYCYPGFTGGDCSERVCPFGRSHVDSPLGDLNYDGIISSPSVTVIRNSDLYPYGTNEKFPNMVTSDQVVLNNTAHGYTECSNKGICNRQNGRCECLDGYEGNACQRLSCPTVNGVVRKNTLFL